MYWARFWVVRSRLTLSAFSNNMHMYSSILMLFSQIHVFCLVLCFSPLHFTRSLGPLSSSLDSIVLLLFQFFLLRFRFYCSQYFSSQFISIGFCFPRAIKLNGPIYGLCQISFVTLRQLKPDHIRIEMLEHLYVRYSWCCVV